jgi:hypothetical protein
MDEDDKTGPPVPSSAIAAAEVPPQLISPKALEPKDPATFPSDDPIQLERWSVTLDGIAKEEAQHLARRLIAAGIPCHLQVIASRVTSFSHTFMGMSGLMEVCVRREDLLQATDIAEDQFPEAWKGERLAHGRLWTPSQIGKEVSVLCLLPWAECWDLAAQLQRHGIPAIVLIYHLDDPVPKETMTYAESMAAEARDSAERWSRFMGVGSPEDDVPIEERYQYSVAVEEPRLSEAVDFARAYLGDSFALVGTPYDG